MNVAYRLRLKQLHWMWCDIRSKYNRYFSLASMHQSTVIRRKFPLSSQP